MTLALLATLPVGPPGLEYVLPSGLLAGGLFFGFIWLFGHAATIAHEGGHALMTLLLGGRVDRVEFYADRNAATWSSGLSTLAGLPVSFHGYVAPSVLGLVGAWVLAHGRADVVLWVSVALMVMLLIRTGNWFGRLLVVAVGLLLLQAARASTDVLQVIAACTWIWMLLIGGLADVLDHWSRAADFQDLRDVTHIPAVVWAGLSLLIAAAALVTGGLMLMGAVTPPI